MFCKSGIRTPTIKQIRFTFVIVSSGFCTLVKVSLFNTSTISSPLRMVVLSVMLVLSWFPTLKLPTFPIQLITKLNQHQPMNKVEFLLFNLLGIWFSNLFILHVFTIIFFVVKFIQFIVSNNLNCLDGRWLDIL